MDEKEATLSLIASLQPSLDLAKRFAERISSLEMADLEQARQQIIQKVLGYQNLN